MVNTQGVQPGVVYTQQYQQAYPQYGTAPHPYTTNVIYASGPPSYDDVTKHGPPASAPPPSYGGTPNYGYVGNEGYNHHVSNNDSGSGGNSGGFGGNSGGNDGGSGGNSGGGGGCD